MTVDTCVARVFALAATSAAMVALAACGGSGNPFDNPPQISNPAQSTGGKLSFAYFQRCVYPVLLAQLQINSNGAVTTNSCAAAGCHDNVNGTGGAMRVVPTATVIDTTDPANTPELIRASDMYKNFYSAQGETVIGSPSQSRLMNKPLVRGVLHGGGLIFASDQDPNAKVIQYWISRPAPQSQDEFSNATFSMFTPADPRTGACNIE